MYKSATRLKGAAWLQERLAKEGVRLDMIDAATLVEELLDLLDETDADLSRVDV